MRRNSINSSLDETNGLLTEVTSATQATTNYQTMNGYNSVSIFSSTADAVIANTTTETTLVGTGTGTITLPANFLVAAKTIRFKASGYIGTILTPTLRLRLKFGSTAVIDTGALTLLSITGTNLWQTEGTVTCRTTGATGSVQGQGMTLYFTSTTGIAGLGTPMTSATTIDTTSTQVLSLTAQWGTASASNTMTCTNFLLEVTM